MRVLSLFVSFCLFSAVTPIQRGKVVMYRICKRLDESGLFSFRDAKHELILPEEQCNDAAHLAKIR